MANPDHVAQLKKGVDAWNVWREKNRTRPRLSGANLGRRLLQTNDRVEAAETRMISVQLKVEGPTLDNGRGTQTAGVAPSRLDYFYRHSNRISNRQSHMVLLVNVPAEGFGSEDNFWPESEASQVNLAVHLPHVASWAAFVTVVAWMFVPTK